jgi:hypothetical protein
MKGRNVPPRIPQWTMPQVLAFMQGRRGMLLFKYCHDDGCRAQETQRLEDCRCKHDIYLTDHEGRDIAQVVAGPATPEAN